MSDQRKASYQAALTVWRERLQARPEFKPNGSAFGLTEVQANEVEQDGYGLEGLPENLRPRAVERPIPASELPPRSDDETSAVVLGWEPGRRWFSCFYNYDTEVWHDDKGATLAPHFWRPEPPAPPETARYWTGADILAHAPEITDPALCAALAEAAREEEETPMTPDLKTVACAVADFHDAYSESAGALDLETTAEPVKALLRACGAEQWKALAGRQRAALETALPLVESILQETSGRMAAGLVVREVLADPDGSAAVIEWEELREQARENHEILQQQRTRLEGYELQVVALRVQLGERDVYQG
jgi:hypothetical protein